MKVGGPVFEEDGTLAQSEDFDWNAVDRDVFKVQVDSDLRQINQKSMDGAVKALRCILQWVAKPGSRNANGIQLRAICVCWVFLKELRPLTLSDVARAFKKHKQSLGRQMDDFKRTFPNIRTPHMR